MTPQALPDRQKRSMFPPNSLEQRREEGLRAHPEES
jgi:hypothetical protein